MGRWTLGPALVLTASISLSIIGVPAEAAPRPDPVAALKRKLNGHGGVRESTVFRSVSGPKKDRVTSRAKTVFEFGGGEIVASDLRFSSSLGDSRRIAFSDRVYVWEPGRPDYLPAGKSWIVSTTKKNDLFISCGKIRLSDPAVLRHVLATTTAKRPDGVYDGTRTTLYEGSTTIGELYKLDPSVWVDNVNKPTGQHASYRKLPVKWQLWLGSDQLVRRCQTRYDEPDSIWNVEDRHLVISDERYSGWHDPIDVKPPPAELVATRDELVFSDDD
ncbi:hypothetical protein AB0C28_20720 [Nonomuraea sp. NPDC048892]|uniref:hypothetical protein n=1 Tax=Nonomuraea sp. NPDC048892 TaxID=3154624 RepID=UPI0033F4CEB0